jgi:hypothetical protein
MNGENQRRTARRSLAAVVAALVVAGNGCAETTVFGDGAPPPGDGSPPALDFGIYDLGSWPREATVYTGEPVVYAHTASELYKVNPDTLAITLVAPFSWPSLPDEMTDIALDKAGRMIGISFDKVYSVDPKTATCTYLAPLSRRFNGLSFIAPASAEGQEYLMATAIDGSVFRIDPNTGKSMTVGNFTGGLGSSGDLVSIKGFGTVATVKDLGKITDWLARIDPLNGKATLIGDTGFSDVWGLGFWKNKVYGFTESGQFILIDIKNGSGQLVPGPKRAWWGAGVTTVAPVIE